MAIRYSDQEIGELIRERKLLPRNYSTSIRFKTKQGHKEYDLDIKGDDGNDFRLIIRQSSSNFIELRKKPFMTSTFTWQPSDTRSLV